MPKKTDKKKKKKLSPKVIVEKQETPEFQGLFLLCGTSLITLSLLSFSFGNSSQNALGVIGNSIGWAFHAIFGLGSYILVCFLGWLGWRMLLKKPINSLIFKTFYFTVLLISFCMLLSLVEDRYPEIGNYLGNSLYKQQWKNHLHYHLGGAVFYFFYHDLPVFNIKRLINEAGAAIVFSATFIASFLILFKIRPSNILNFISILIPKPLPDAEPPVLESADPLPIPPVPVEPSKGGFLRFVKLRIPNFSSPSQQVSKEPPPQLESPDLLAIQPDTILKSRPSISQKELTEKKGEQPFLEQRPRQLSETPFPVTRPFIKEKPSEEKPKEILTVKKVKEIDCTINPTPPPFNLPGVAILSAPKKVDQAALKKDLRRQAEVLEETLLSFGIEAKVGQINCGPTITSFEVHPAIGVKVQKIRTLENDIALNMEAKSIRIIAPIPGKAAVGIEVPNAVPQEVSFKELLTAYQQSSKKFHIPLLLGKAVNGDYVMADLAKMPHCIIAGATGSGKSVCINTLVMSILYNARPDEIKLLMVDPKKVELTPYTALPHMLSPVITEPQEACAALNWLVKEMESRYEILKLIGVRNIDAFNNRKIDTNYENSLPREIPLKLPYIVGIIDELADLMMVSTNDIETPIARIAQMARAVGIHLILATQRPSREVITGLIKANFPTRIAFKVASRVNSQIILDETGAELLLGNGDMLFLPPGTSTLIRAQGAFIRDDDINAVIRHICNQAPPQYVIKSFEEGEFEEDPSSKKGGYHDPLYAQAVEAVQTSGNASINFLQRKLKIRYLRAAALMDQLESKGVVGPAEGTKPRQVLLKSSKKEDFLDE